MSCNVYELFEHIGSITALREIIEDDKPDLAHLIKTANYEFKLQLPSDDELSEQFDMQARMWNRHTYQSIAEFALWVKWACAQDNVLNANEPSLREIVDHVEKLIDGKETPDNNVHQFIQKMDRAGLAIWEWLGKLEKNDLGYVGLLVHLDEKEAFSDQYYPDAFEDVKDIVQKTVLKVLESNGLSFGYYNNQGKIKPGANLNAPG